MGHQALMLKGYEGEGPNFIPLPDATLLMGQERRGTRQALALVLETAMDAGGLEDENRELCKAMARLQVGGFEHRGNVGGCDIDAHADTDAQRTRRPHRVSD
jgi:hypothetical protein